MLELMDEYRREYLAINVGREPVCDELLERLGELSTPHEMRRHLSGATTH